MRRLTLLGAMTLLVPGLAGAQAGNKPRPAASPATQAEVEAKARAEAEAATLAGVTPMVATRLRAILDAAAHDSLPTEPILDRIAKAKAQGAAEGAIIAESERALGRMKMAQAAMAGAGRAPPSPEELIRACSVIERGVTAAQLEALASKAPAQRPIRAAFEVLNELIDRGVPVERALTEVGTRLAAGDSDDQLYELKSTMGLQLGRRP